MQQRILYPSSSLNGDEERQTQVLPLVTKQEKEPTTRRRYPRALWIILCLLLLLLLAVVVTLTVIFTVARPTSTTRSSSAVTTSNSTLVPSTGSEVSAAQQLPPPPQSFPPPGHPAISPPISGGAIEPLRNGTGIATGTAATPASNLPPTENSPPVVALSPPVRRPRANSPPVRSPPVNSPPVRSPPVNSPANNSPPAAVRGAPVKRPPVTSPPPPPPLVPRKLICRPNRLSLRNDTGCDNINFYRNERICRKSSGGRTVTLVKKSKCRRAVCVCEGCVLAETYNRTLAGSITQKVFKSCGFKTDSPPANSPPVKTQPALKSQPERSPPAVRRSPVTKSHEPVRTSKAAKVPPPPPRMPRKLICRPDRLTLRNDTGCDKILFYRNERICRKSSGGRTVTLVKKSKCRRAVCVCEGCVLAETYNRTLAGSLTQKVFKSCGFKE